MNLTLTIIINAVLDTAIIGSLAFVMSRSARLKPHAPQAAPRAARARRTARPRPERVPARLGTALD